MQLYRYYKGHQKKGVWKSVAVESEAQALAASTTGFQTVLAVSERAGAGESISDDAYYQGPFYIDIDDDNIEKSIKAAQKVFKKLTENGVPRSALNIWATGKRGFHFTIPMEYFTDERPVKRLPLVYKFMALALKLPDETDMSVYSQGKGRMWRQENKERIDNQRFKVRISSSELEHMTRELYDSLTSIPREDFEPEDGPLSRNSFLAALFSLALGKSAKAVKPPAVFVDPELKKALDGSLPPCGRLMLAGKDVDKSKGFNALSMQFAKAVAAFAPSEARDLIKDFAENNQGDKYNTVRKRSDHCNTAFRIASKNTNYDWSCRSALSILKSEPCMDCPIAHIRVEQEDARNGVKQGDAPKPKVKPAPAPKTNGSTAPKQSLPTYDLEKDDVDLSTLPKIKLGLPPSMRNGAAPVPAPAPAPKAPKERPVKITVEASSPMGASMKMEYTDQDPNDAPDEYAGPSDDGDGVGEEDADSGETMGAAEEQPRGDDAAANDEGLLILDEGYGFMDGHGHVRRISNFTFKIKKYYSEYVQNLDEYRRVAIMADLYIGGKRVGNAMLEESNWNSKSSLIGCLGGIANAAFYGKDDDVQRMKSALMANIEDSAENIMRVHAAGIHRAMVNGQYVFTYVEPGWSIDQFGNQDKYFLSGKVAAAPALKHVKLPEKGDLKLSDMLLSLMSINRPENIAQMFAWYAACFLKQHFFAFRNEFPLLGVHGNRGSGKSATTAMLASLHGCDYFMEHSPLSLASATPFAVWTTITSSMTMPRIMEEYNKSKLPRRYDEYGEYFKDCWNQYSIQRGTLNANKGHGSTKSGAHLMDFPLTGAVVVCSEQGVTMPALVQRMIQVPLSPHDLNYPGARDHFNKVRRRMKEFLPFAKLMYMEAVQTSVEQVQEWLDSYDAIVPMEIGDRPHYSYCVMLVGLKFFETVCQKHGLDVQEHVEYLRKALMNYLENDATAIQVTKNRSEVDIIIDKFATMAALSEGQGVARLESKVHYIHTGQYIYLDGITCFMFYQRHMAQVERSPAVIDSFATFKALLRNESYCESVSEVQDGFARGRPVIKLNVAGMAAKGIEVAGFEEE